MAKKSVWTAMSEAVAVTQAAYNRSGSVTAAAGTFWNYTKDYFLPNRQIMQQDGSRWGQSYRAIETLDGQSQELAIAVTALARELGSSDWKLASQVEGQDNLPVIDETLPVMKLLRHPNGLHSWQSFIETAAMLLVPTGNCYILKDPISVAGTPMSLWILRSDRCMPIRNNQPLAPILGYQYFADDGIRYVFPPDRVIHIKQPNPLNDYIGLGAVNLLRNTLEMDFRSMESNIQKFRQDVRMGLVIEGVENTDPVYLAELKNKLAEAHGGSENSFRPLILTGASKLNAAAMVGKSQEADYMDTRKDIARGIGSVLGVPPMYMGIIDDINRTTAVVQRDMFLKNGVWPLMMRFKPAFDEIVKSFDPSFTFDWPRVEVMDPDSMGKIMEVAMQNAVTSPNDAREKFLQLPRTKDPKMDLHYILSTYGPVELGVGPDATAAAQAKYQPPKPVTAAPTPGVAKPVAPAPAAKIPPKKLTRLSLKDGPGNFPKGTEKQRRILGALKANRPKIEEAIAPIFEKHIRAFGNKAADAIEKKGKSQRRYKSTFLFQDATARILKAYDSDGTTSGMKEDAQDAYVQQAAKLAQDAGLIFGVDMTAFSPDSVSTANIASQIAQRVTWMDQSNKDKLAQIIQDGTAQGLSPWEIANGTTDESFPGIRETFDGIAQEHSMLIARTETAHLQDAVNTEAYKKMGVTVCDVIGCEDFVIMPDESYGCNSQDVPVSALPISFHPNHAGAVVPQ